MEIKNQIISNSNSRKVKIKVPEYIINKINGLISLNGSEAKILRELKGILIGRYPNTKALVNSLKGVEKKLNSLNEAKSSSLKQKLLPLITALIIAASSTAVGAGINAIKDTNQAPQTIENQKEVTEKSILYVTVDQKKWAEISKTIDEIYLSKIANLKTIEDVISFNKILSKYNIQLINVETTKYKNSLAAYDSETKQIVVSLKHLKELNRISPNPMYLKILLRHELTHKNQFVKIPYDLMKNDFDKKSYSNRYQEINAYHEQIKEIMEDKKTNGLRAYDNFKYATELIPDGVIKNMIKYYGKEDKVVKYMLNLNPALGN